LSIFIFLWFFQQAGEAEPPRFLHRPQISAQNINGAGADVIRRVGKSVQNPCPFTVMDGFVEQKKIVGSGFQNGAQAQKRFDGHAYFAPFQVNHKPPGFVDFLR
jgi:hypothetical protein